ncbi:MAG: hypothetical protein UHP27_01650 [Muribaculaceae bacterium]|nr:hypothetical protein [Muribaculaceae bacterium]
MKKATLLAMACALFMGTTAFAQEAQETQYVEDPSQGYLFNSFKDNWFITAEGGAGVYFSHGDSKRAFRDRFSPAAGLYIGKWFSPVIGARIGAHFLVCKGLSDVETPMTRPGMINGKYNQKFNEIGPAFDVMLNLTNWWCGYKPNRVYNAIFYAGAGGFWTYEHRFKANGEGDGWHADGDRILTVRAGLINSFNVSKQVALSLDIRWNGMDNHKDEAGDAWNRTSHDIQAYLGVTYLFNKRTWSAPIVPVCAPAENCDALRERLAAAEGRIADLENQLRDCLNRPTPKAEKKAPLATIYYPINVYRLTNLDKKLLGAVSNVMKDNPSKHYTLTGWADNYTGTDKINVRLRHNRVNGVEKQLIKNGVPQSQLTATINNGNLVDLGEKYVALDRAVTIEED